MKHRRTLFPAALLGTFVWNTCISASFTKEVSDQGQPRQDLIDSRPTVRNAKEQQLAEQQMLLAELLKERQARAKLRLTYSDQHPAVIQSNRKIEEIEKRLRELSVDVTPPPSVQAPTR